jgi:hypothetical protein
MLHEELAPILFYVWWIGVGGSILAFGLLLLEMGPRRRWGMMLSGGLAVALLGLDVVLWARGLPSPVCGAAAILPAACALAWAAHFAGVRRWASRLLDPRVVWAGVLILFPLSAFYLTYGLNRPPPANDPAMELPLEPARVDRVSAVTDCGRDIEVFNYAFHELADVIDQVEWLREQEESCLDNRSWKWQVIRVGSPDLNSNCHGWVFTDGKFAILSREVDHILADNQYSQTSQAQPGDVIVYRDEQDQVLHSGMVRFVSGSGLVLVESKWGPLGRYLHPPECQPWGGHFSYYRSSRGGHQLRIVTATEGVQGRQG